MKNYYQILNLDPTASSEEIKRAYKIYASKYHPDKHGGNDEFFKERFHEISEAYSVLLDSDKRRQLDDYLKSFYTKQADTTYASDVKQPEQPKKASYEKTGTTKPKETGRHYYEHSYSRLQAGDHAEAFTYIEKAIKTEPKNADFVLAKAIILKRVNDYSGYRKSLAKASSLGNNRARTLMKELEAESESHLDKISTSITIMAFYALIIEVVFYNIIRALSGGQLISLAASIGLAAMFYLFLIKWVLKTNEDKAKNPLYHETILNSCIIMGAVMLIGVPCLMLLIF